MLKEQGLQKNLRIYHGSASTCAQHVEVLNRNIQHLLEKLDDKFYNADLSFEVVSTTMTSRTLFGVEWLYALIVYRYESDKGRI